MRIFQSHSCLSLKIDTTIVIKCVPSGVDNYEPNQHPTPQSLIQTNGTCQRAMALMQVSISGPAGKPQEHATSSVCSSARCVPAIAERSDSSAGKLCQGCSG